MTSDLKANTPKYSPNQFLHEDYDITQRAGFVEAKLTSRTFLTTTELILVGCFITVWPTTSAYCNAWNMEKIKISN